MSEFIMSVILAVVADVSLFSYNTIQVQTNKQGIDLKSTGTSVLLVNYQLKQKKHSVTNKVSFKHVTLKIKVLPTVLL